MSIEFPKDKSKGIVVDDVMKSLRHAFLQAVTLKEGVTSIDWKGPTNIPSIAAGCPPPHVNLSEEMLEYHAERDRDVLDMLILTAFQLGFENGHRSQEDRISLYKMVSRK